MKVNNYDYMISTFVENGINFFSGVPDSTFKDFVSHVDSFEDVSHIKAVNECEAISLCAGHYLSSGKPGVVYMQNSGLGKIVNPMTSLLSAKSYDIPVILLIGYRGVSGEKSPHQHVHMGKITESLLSLLDIEYFILENESEIYNVIENVIDMSKDKRVAILIKKGLFEDKESVYDDNDFSLGRREVIETVVSSLSEDCLYLSTTGMISRELFDIRKKSGSNAKDFYMAGSMGCIGDISMVIAKENPDRNVVVFDGDGALLMQMGSLATIGNEWLDNFCHIVLDNEAYDSTGGQSSLSSWVDYNRLADACGYRSCSVVYDMEKLNTIVGNIRYIHGPMMIVVKIKKEHGGSVCRPDIGPKEIKNNFMENFNE